jgi:CBS domain-containing protein
VAEGKNPVEAEAGDVMSSPVVTVTPDMRLEQVADLMEEHQLRRVPVVDEAGAVCGIVAQADIAQHASPREVAEVVREVSR